MSENKIETSAYSKTAVEHYSSPVVMNNLHNNESFHSTRSLSYSDMDLSQQHQGTEEFYLSYVMNINDNTYNHLETSQHINQYPLNKDTHPEHIRRYNNNQVTYQQDVSVRYLQLPAPPPPSHIYDLGIARVDPDIYAAQYGSQLASNKYALNIMTKFDVDNNYAYMIQIYQNGINCDYIEKNIEEIILPDGRRKFHSNTTSPSLQENRQFSPSSGSGSRSTKHLPGHVASPPSHHSNIVSVTPTQSPVCSMNPSLSKQHPQLSTDPLARINRHEIIVW
ncbi:unnamed protein product [Adineta steineri]|uniref:Uncharacterized protein n=1 Tax=Adineta steineri TaxID=433720 RepID=A0A819N0L4_9BILA|nr:unnamed protein product [Adineta steineri]